MTQIVPTIAACPHCGTAVEGPEGSFCCHGCEAAAAILSEAGLESWYATREQPAPRARVATGVAWDRLPMQALDDGSVRAELDVDGFRCASCVWVTEKMLERTPGVRQAHVSYATGRATLAFDPGTTDLGALAGRIAQLGYAPRPAGRTATVDRDLLRRLGVAAFAALNIMGLAAALYTGWIDGMDDRWAQLFRWGMLVLATPLVTYAAVPFFRGAAQALRHGLLHMDLPIALAVTLLYGHGLWATLAHTDSYLDSLGMLVALLLTGRVLEARGRKRAVEAASTLAAVVPRTARKVVDDRVEEVATDTLVPGDRVDLGAGDEVPADGIVAHGKGMVRMAVLTGESRPVEVAVGDRVVAGAVVEGGALQLGVTRSGDQTLVQSMARDLATAQAAPREPTAADRLAPAFTAATLAVAATTAVLTSAFLGVDTAIARTAAVLVVACPCALALAAPLVGAAGLGAAARRGLLLRDGEVLRRLAQVDTVVLDKTGTVTWGRPRVVAAEDAALRVAAGLERFSRHPVAMAIVEEAVSRGIPIPVADDVAETPGTGITGTLGGVRYALKSGGPDRVVLTADTGAAWVIALEDRPRDEAAADLRALQDAGHRVVLLTGDHEAVAGRIAAELGVGEVVAGATPDDKVATLARLRAEGRFPLFVGDGLNDGPAMQAAHVGVAMATGAASTVWVADGVLGGDRLAPLVAALQIAPVTERRVTLNLWRSIVYNVAAVGAAVVGLVNPLVAAILMPLSSGLVIASAHGVEADVAARLAVPMWRGR